MHIKQQSYEELLQQLQGRRSAASVHVWESAFTRSIHIIQLLLKLTKMWIRICGTELETAGGEVWKRTTGRSMDPSKLDIIQPPDPANQYHSHRGNVASTFRMQHHTDTWWSPHTHNSTAQTCWRRLFSNEASSSRSARRLLFSGHRRNTSCLHVRLEPLLLRMTQLHLTGIHILHRLSPESRRKQEQLWGPSHDWADRALWLAAYLDAFPTW